MKLIFCTVCHDIFRLSDTPKACMCGASHGQYTDALNATYGGSAVPLGISNQSLVMALKNRPECGQGQGFVAFVIPKNCDTYKREQ
jgi:hypothetical protein